jgi:molybdopterin converting factor small subunit
VRRLELPASTVGEMIDALDARWPGMRDRLCDSRPAIRRHINIFVEGRRATLETRLSPDAEVTVLTAISGG